MLDLILLSGAIGPAIVAAAYLLWRAGVRDPLLLTVGALVIGGSSGWLVNTALEKLLDPKRWKKEP